MKLIKPFRGLKPTKALASQVASPPYDVLSRAEAKEIAQGNPYSFLHINKPDIDVSDELDQFDPTVYQVGRDNLDEFMSSGVLIQDENEQFYLYRQVMGDHEQLGLVAVASIDAYDRGLIKIHEYTRPDKEGDRVNHMEALGAQVGPVFLTYKADPGITEILDKAKECDSDYDFEDETGVRHTFWTLSDKNLASAIEERFQSVDTLYIADGHHRSAAASRVRENYRKTDKNGKGTESYNFFLAVVFPSNQMKILDYNRVLKDLNGLSVEEFLNALSKYFLIEQVEGEGDAKPKKVNEFGLYLHHTWYRLTLRIEIADKLPSNDPVKGLDVSILQDYILTPILEINDQRTDKRIDFVGGIKGLSGLKERVNSGKWTAAVALYPTSIDSLIAVADAGQVMPPKSTWFEPKLKSGLVSHLLE